MGWTTAWCQPLSPRRGARVYEITGRRDWADLTARYPLEVTRSRRHDWWRVTGRAATWLIPDYAAVAADYDAIHLTVLATSPPPAWTCPPAAHAPCWRAGARTLPTGSHTGSNRPDQHPDGNRSIISLLDGFKPPTADHANSFGSRSRLVRPGVGSAFGPAPNGHSAVQRPFPGIAEMRRFALVGIS
jgi:hypothetical protein